MSDDGDDTSQFNNNPEDEDEPQQPVDDTPQTPTPLPPKRKRARSSASRVAYDAESDSICLAISAFLNQKNAPPLTHRAVFDLNGTQVSIGNMMYTLRRHSRKADQSVIVQSRLKYLANNPKWTQFMEDGREPKPPQELVPSNDDTPQTQQKQPVQKPKLVGLEGDIWKHAHVILGKSLQFCKMPTEMAELRLLLWQSIPDMRPTILQWLLADIKKHNYKKQCV